MYSWGCCRDDFVFDGDALAAFLRHHIDDDVAVLTATPDCLTSLPSPRKFSDRFAIRDLRRTGVGLDVELAAHAVHDDDERTPCRGWRASLDIMTHAREFNVETTPVRRKSRIAIDH